jgi:hypothetical protein
MQTALKIIGISFVALAALGGGIYAAAQALETTETQSEKISRPVDQVVIKAESGDVEVVPGGRHVEVERTDTYVLDSPDVNRTVQDGVLTIEAECDSAFSPFCSTDYRVNVPKGVTVDVRTYVGDVDIEGIDARRVEARAYVGDVHVDAARKGDVTARTNVGDVDIDLPSGTYDIVADIAVGDSDVEGLNTSDRSRHRVDARADVGTVDVTARRY